MAKISAQGWVTGVRIRELEARLAGGSEVGSVCSWEFIGLVDEVKLPNIMVGNMVQEVYRYTPVTLCTKAHIRIGKNIFN